MEVALQDMIPIPIGEFILGSKTPVDLYVRLSNDKFVLIAKSGSSTPQEQLRQYNNRALEYIWVLRADYAKVAKQSISLAGLIVAKKDVDFRNKTTVVSAAARTVFTQLDHMGISIEMYNNAKVITEAMVSMCEAHRDLSELFEGLKSSSDHLLTQSVAVAALSTMIGVAMGFEKKITLEKLALGGLLHDIGQKSLPSDLLKKPVALMTPDEVSLMETHAYRGMQLVLSLGIVPDDVVSIIYEHHENSIGQGYPRRIRDIKIHPLAKIVALADQFVTLTMANPNCPTPKNTREALMYIEHTMGQPFNREVFRALKRVVEKDSFTSAA